MFWKVLKLMEMLENVFFDKFLQNWISECFRNTDGKFPIYSRSIPLIISITNKEFNVILRQFELNSPLLVFNNIQVATTQFRQFQYVFGN